MLSQRLLLQPDDARRNEDQQLATLILDSIPLEQPPEQRNAVQTRRATLERLFITEIDPANHGRLAVVDE